MSISDCLTYELISTQLWQVSLCLWPSTGRYRPRFGPVAQLLAKDRATLTVEMKPLQRDDPAIGIGNAASTKRRKGEFIVAPIPTKRINTAAPSTTLTEGRRLPGRSCADSR
jgi:hypothetical protein